MDYAVVKFVNEAETDEEVVSEVPSTWLTKGNKFCMWPPEKYAGIYISKKFPPQPDWKEHQIELECFCETLAEAKQKTKNSAGDKVGRGFRVSKPVDYFSPGEEEERVKDLKRDNLLKKSIFSIHNQNENYHENFVSLLNLEDKAPDKEHESEDVKIVEDSQDDKEQNVMQDSSSPIVQEALRKYDSSSLTAKEITVDCTVDGSAGSFAASIISDNDMLKMSKKLDTISSLLTTMKLDMDDIKERLQHISPSNQVEDIDKMPIALPLQSLTDLENLESYLKSKPEAKIAFAKCLRDIGGNDAKDFVTRCCRTIFTNSLGEACSWTGRKNNFPVSKLDCINVLFGVIHHKTRATKKEFENIMAEWLRHSKQRREREEKREKEN